MKKIIFWIIAILVCGSIIQLTIGIVNVLIFCFVVSLIVGILSIPNQIVINKRQYPCE